MMSGNTIEKRDPQALKPHPLNKDLYDPTVDEEFVNRVRMSGIREPLVVVPDSHFTEAKNNETIISGHRRWRAAKKLDYNEVPVQVRDPYDSKLEEEAALLDYNDQRDKTFSEKMREAEKLESVLGPLAEKRQKGQSLDEDEKGLYQNLAEGDEDSINEIIGDRIGWSHETYRKARKVWKWGEKENVEPLEEAIMDIDDGEESIHGAYQRFKRLQKKGKLEELSDGGRIDISDIPGSASSDLRSPYLDHYDEWLRNALVKWLEGEESSSNPGWNKLIDKLHEFFQNRYQSEPNTESAYVFAYLLEKDDFSEVDEVVHEQVKIPTPKICIGEEEVELPSVSDRKPPREALQELYLQKGRSLAEIAARYGVVEELVREWLFEENVPLREEDVDKGLIEVREEESVQMPAIYDSSNSDSAGIPNDPFQDETEENATRTAD